MIQARLIRCRENVIQSLPRRLARYEEFSGATMQPYGLLARGGGEMRY